MEEFDKKVGQLRMRFPYTLCQISEMPGVKFLLDSAARNVAPVTASTEMQVRCGCHLCGKRALQDSDGKEEMAKLKLTRIVLNNLQNKGLHAKAQLRAEGLEEEHVFREDLLAAAMCKDTQNGHFLCDDCIKANELQLQTCCDCGLTHAFAKDEIEPGVTALVTGDKSRSICEKCRAEKWTPFTEDGISVNSCHCCGKTNFNGVEFVMMLAVPVFRKICINCILAEPIDKLETNMVDFISKTTSVLADHRIAETSRAWQEGLDMCDRIMEAFRVQDKTDDSLNKAFQVVSTQAYSMELLAETIADARNDLDACKAVLNCKRKPEEEEEDDGGEDDGVEKPKTKRRKEEEGR